MKENNIKQYHAMHSKALGPKWTCLHRKDWRAEKTKTGPEKKQEFFHSTKCKCALGLENVRLTVKQTVS